MNFKRVLSDPFIIRPKYLQISLVIDRMLLLLLLQDLAIDLFATIVRLDPSLQFSRRLDNL